MPTFLSIFKAVLYFSRDFSYTLSRRQHWLLSTETSCWLPHTLGMEKIMQLKDIKIDWTTVASVLALPYAMVWWLLSTTHLKRSGELCGIFKTHVLQWTASSLLSIHSHPASHLGSQLPYQHSSLRKTPSLSLYTSVLHFTRFSTSVAWALEPDSLKHLCLQDCQKVTLIWKIH